MDTKELFLTGLVKAPVAVLLALRVPSNAGRTATETAAASGVPLNATSMALDTLARRGLVVKQFPARDARKVRCYLTTAGLAKTAELVAAIQKFGVASAMQETCHMSVVPGVVRSFM